MKSPALSEPEWDHWESHPDHPVEDWKYEVANDDTRIGYSEWVRNRIEASLNP